MIYNIVETYKSRQGEGYNQGREVIFLRFGKCNLKCPWCDTDYNTFSEVQSVDLIHKLDLLKCKSIILTGGEPTIQKGLHELLTVLKSKDYWLAMETNGVTKLPQPTRAKIDYVACSPKILYQNLYRTQDALTVADEIRIVVDDSPPIKTINFCEEIRERIYAQHYYLSPCEVDGSFNMNKTLEILGELNKREGYNKWKLSIQAHKLANIR